MLLQTKFFVRSLQLDLIQSNSQKVYAERKLKKKTETNLQKRLNLANNLCCLFTYFRCVLNCVKYLYCEF